MIAAYPQSWWLFLLLPLMLLLFLWRFKGAYNDIHHLGYSRGSGFGHRMITQRFVQAFLFLLVYLLLVFALMDFHWGREPVPQDSGGTDIALVLDLSYSMLAEDSYPNRLSAGKEALLILMQNLQNTRYGLILFKGEPMVAVPLTEDKIILERYIQLAEPAWMTSPGSNLEKALLKAMEILESKQDRKEIVLLVTDGEELEGQALRTARQWIEGDGALVILALGDTEGVAVDLGEGEFLTDSSGNRVITRQNQSMLQELARVSDGVYFNMNSPGAVIDLQKYIEDTSGTGLGIRYERPKKYRVFLFPGIVLLILHQILGRLTWRRK